MTLLLKTTFKMEDSPSSRELADLFALSFPEGRFRTATGGGIYWFEIDLDTPVTPKQKDLFLDLMRSIDAQLVETVFVQGRLGDEAIRGYLGPERKRKEKSRSRLEAIRQQLSRLLPEHKVALRAILADG